MTVTELIHKLQMLVDATQEQQVRVHGARIITDDPDVLRHVYRNERGDIILAS